MPQNVSGSMLVCAEKAFFRFTACSTNGKIAAVENVLKIDEIRFFRIRFRKTTIHHTHHTTTTLTVLAGVKHSTDAARAAATTTTLLKTLISLSDVL
jgi:hypothetical protein